MEKRNNGGHAFPATGPVSNHGMTLRDYLATQAMAAMTGRAVPPAGSDGSWGDIATRAYAAADAMLAERAK